MALERKSIQTERGNINREIVVKNKQFSMLQSEVKQLENALKQKSPVVPLIAQKPKTKSSEEQINELFVQMIEKAKEHPKYLRAFYEKSKEILKDRTTTEVKRELETRFIAYVVELDQ